MVISLSSRVQVNKEYSLLFLLNLVFEDFWHVHTHTHIPVNLTRFYGPPAALSSLFPRQIIILLFCSANYWLNKKNAYCFIFISMLVCESIPHVCGFHQRMASENSVMNQAVISLLPRVLGIKRWSSGGTIKADPSQDAEGSSNYRSTWDKGTLDNNCWAHRLKADPRSRPICTGTFLELSLQVFLGSCGTGAGFFSECLSACHRIQPSPIQLCYPSSLATFRISKIREISCLLRPLL